MPKYWTNRISPDQGGGRPTRAVARRLAIAALTLLAVVPACTAAASGDVSGDDVTTPKSSPAPGRGDVATAKSATAGYHRVAAAERDGYALPPDGVPLHECISAVDAQGAMGYHWINGAHVGDAVLDPARPEVLVYEPTGDDGFRLVGLEYVVFADKWEAKHPGTTPRLFGRDLSLVSAPNRYELPAFYQVHVWAWKNNPEGMFADFNPRVSCRQPTSEAAFKDTGATRFIR